MESVLKLFEDKELTREILEKDILPLGTEPVPAGESRQFRFYLQNPSLAYIKEIIVDVPHNEVHVVEAPMEMYPHTVEEIIIQWDASVTLKEGLKTRINISAKEIYG